MPTLTIELPPQSEQTEFNVRRWSSILGDPDLAKIEGRIETDRYGYVIMSPPAGADHSGFQLEIGAILRELMPRGRVMTECPISTADGVRVADVAWASPKCIKAKGNLQIFPRCPEICVEIVSPGNTTREMKEKVALYFDAGAEEVWVCNSAGKITFYRRGDSRPLSASAICPTFPPHVAFR